jgi:exodeoxyribonuclease VII small subunit
VSKQPPSRKRAGKSEDSAEGLSFEQAVERLEEIIDRIESGEAGLERSLVEFEEGTRLLRHCREILAKAEQKVVELTPDGNAAGPKPRPSPPRGRDEDPEEAPF